MCSTRILVVLTIGLWALNLPAAEPITPAVQQELLRKADDWKVPRPAAMSQVVKVWAFKSMNHRSGGYIDKYALGFLDPDDPSRVLVGFDWWDAKNHHATPVSDLETLSLEDISAASPFSAAHEVNSGLLTGIQFLRRGDEKLGLKLIMKATRESTGHPRSHFYSRTGEPPVLMLARSCLAAALNRITTPAPDFRAIKQEVDQLLADQSQLRNEGTDWIVESLQANVDHVPAPAGTMEQIIDDYLLCGSRRGMEHVSKAERTLTLKGFEAVPALLKQRHSQRFSNHLMEGFNNFPSYPMSAGQVVDQYLQSLANDTMKSDQILNATLADNEVQSWWTMAQGLGEEAYVKRFTFTKDRHNNWSLSDPLLMIAGDRYPALLPGIYKSMLQTSYPSWPVADAIMECDSIPKRKKLELLNEGVATEHVAHRNTALEHLRKIDPAFWDAELLRLLQEAPDTAEKEYWTDQDAGLSRHVAASTNLKVWNEFHALLDRADLGTRMELIDRLYPPRNAPREILQSFYAVYDQFQADPTIRDESTSRKFRGPGAGFPHKQIAMQDFIHIHWSRWLKLPIPAPEEEVTPEEWTTYRSTIRSAILKNREQLVVESTPPPQREGSFIGSMTLLCLAALAIAAAKHK